VDPDEEGAIEPAIAGSQRAVAGFVIERSKGHVQDLARGTERGWPLSDLPATPLRYRTGSAARQLGPNRLGRRAPASLELVL